MTRTTRMRLRMSHAWAAPPSPPMLSRSSLPVVRLAGASFDVGRKTPAQAAPTMNSILRPRVRRTWTQLARLFRPRLHRLGPRARRGALLTWREHTWCWPGGSGVIGAGPVRPMDEGRHRCWASGCPRSVVLVRSRQQEPRCTSASVRGIGCQGLTRLGNPIVVEPGIGTLTVLRCPRNQLLGCPRTCGLAHS
jgi:hypothetical protein